jgi:hypothetical protein
MRAEQQLELSTEEEQVREALNARWHASAIGDANTEHDIYDDDAIGDYSQSGERILGASNLQAFSCRNWSNWRSWSALDELEVGVFRGIVCAEG